MKSIEEIQQQLEYVRQQARCCTDDILVEQIALCIDLKEIFREELDKRNKIREMSLSK